MTNELVYHRGMSIGQRLREKRHDAGLTLGQVGEHEGITAQYLSDLERGKNQPNTWSLLARLARLTGDLPHLGAESLEGRVGWRWSATDRLPVIGAVPERAAVGVGSADQPRLLPRQEGLFMFTALGSRGIGVSALGARLLAAWVAGAPSPVEASLMDAVDPARFAARARRRSAIEAPPAAVAD